MGRVGLAARHQHDWHVAALRAELAPALNSWMRRRGDVRGVHVLRGRSDVLVALVADEAAGRHYFTIFQGLMDVSERRIVSHRGKTGKAK